MKKIKFIYIGKKQDKGFDEWWTRFYECPKCKVDDIAGWFRYCPSCGIKLKWRKEDKVNE